MRLLSFLRVTRRGLSGASDEFNLADRANRNCYALLDTSEARCTQFLHHFISLHRPGDDVLAVQLLLGEVDHADLAVLIGAEIEPLGFQVAGAGPGV